MQLEKTLILGYGNPDRQDDGAAWHILAGLAGRLGRTAPQWPDATFEPSAQDPSLWFNLQLTPEMASDIARYERVCFVDTHTGNIPKDLNFEILQPQFQNSPFTHHMTPQSCLMLAETLYQARPESILVSVRGYQFGFGHDLSAQTQALVRQAVDILYEWLES